VNARVVAGLRQAAFAAATPKAFASRRRDEGRMTKLQRFGFEIERKENKTPGGEQYLGPPGAEIVGLIPRSATQNVKGLVAVPRYDNLINYHVVAIFEVVNANLRIFSDFRSFDNLPI